LTKLTDLDATFTRHTGGGNYDEVATLAEANGVTFDCPKCGRHSVLVWDHTVPAGIEPGPGRWTMSGTGISDLTLYPSIDLSRSAGVGCLWHGWVTGGAAG
jgi:hypothetical protein